MRGLRFDSMQNHDCVGIENGMFKLWKMPGTYKVLGKSFYEVWADAIYNYTTILVFLFGKETPDLYAAFAKFYNCIYELSTIYK